MTLSYTFPSTLSAIHMFVCMILILSRRFPCATCYEDGHVQVDNSSRLVSGLAVSHHREREIRDINSWCTVSIRTVSYINHWGDNHYCGGAIVTSRWVLTAAHCVTVSSKSSKFRIVERKSITVVVGTMYRLARPDERNILHLSNIWVHSKYERTCNHDIAMLKLHRPIWSSRTYPKRVRLPTEPLDRSTVCYTFGWGRYYMDGPFADELMVIYVTPMPYKTCLNSLESNKDCPFNLCMASADKYGTLCHGDTGGPLYCNGVLYGIAVGMGKRCMEGSLMVFNNLYDHVNWIQYVMVNCASLQQPSRLTLLPLLLLRWFFSIEWVSGQRCHLKI